MKGYTKHIVVLLIISVSTTVAVSASASLIADSNEYPTGHVVNFILTNNGGNNINIIPFAYVFNVTGGIPGILIHDTTSPPATIIVTSGGTYTYGWDQISHNGGIDKQVDPGIYRGEMKWNSVNMAISQTIHIHMRGDIDRDNKVTSSDALLYLRFSVGQNIFPFSMSIMDDVTCDNRITAPDALLVLRKAVGQPVDLQCHGPFLNNR